MKYCVKQILSVAILFISPFYILAQTNPALQTLKAGDKAPALNIIKWMKGKPVQSFKKGHVYIVEFGFVGCTPCRNSIPHLSALAKKYSGKVTLISVHVWENNKEKASDLSYLKRVDDFVKKLGDRISYTVAVDIPQQATADAWMMLNGEKRGAPTSFVVDQNGIIAWIGYYTDLDPIIVQVLAGNFDIYDTAFRQAEEEKLLSIAIKKISQAKRDKDYQTVVQGIDSLIQAHPEKKHFYSLKYNLLKGLDSAKAHAWLQWMLDSNPENYDWYHLIYEVAEGDHADFDQAILVADRAFEQAKTESALMAAMSIHGKAYSYSRKGDFAKAVEIEQQALEYIKENGLPGDSKYFEEQLVIFKKRLKEVNKEN